MFWLLRYGGCLGCIEDVGFVWCRCYGVIIVVFGDAVNLYVVYGAMRLLLQFMVVIVVGDGCLCVVVLVGGCSYFARWVCWLCIR